MELLGKVKICTKNSVGKNVVKRRKNKETKRDQEA